jgi:hypothetical protein
MQAQQWLQEGRDVQVKQLHEVHAAPIRAPWDALLNYNAAPEVNINKYWN